MSKLFDPGQVVELRCPTRRGTTSGYFTDMGALAAASGKLSGTVPGVYATLNPVNPALQARSDNHITTSVQSTTSDADILKRNWLPLDLDAIRPAGISSTDKEHNAALDKAAAIFSSLEERGWPAPIYADSGNGGHLLYRIDLPNDGASTELIGNCLKALDLQFSDDQVAVDVTTKNAARIWKLYGTMACKGDSTEDRPHRKSFIITAPDPIQSVPIELLMTLADTLPVTPPRSRHDPREKFDLAHWIATSGLQVAFEGDWNGQDGMGHKWILNPCPWDSGHMNRSAYILQFPSGAISAGCHHNGCAGNDWYSFRKLIDPSWEPYVEESDAPLAPPGNGQPSKPTPQAEGQPASRITAASILTPRELIATYDNFINTLRKAKIETGWRELDKTLRGVTPGEVLTAIAKSGTGKTAFIQNILWNLALRRQATTLFCSMEQPEHQCLERYAQLAVGKSGGDIESGWQIPEERERITTSLLDLMGEDMLTCAESGLSVKEIEEVVIVAKEKLGKPINFLAIDYLGLIDGSDLDKTLYGQVSRVAREIKNLAKRQSIAVGLICQVSRMAGDDGSKPLSINSARESGAIEESADFLLGLYRSQLHMDDNTITIQVLKNRKGRNNVEFSYEFNHTSLEIGKSEVSLTGNRLS